MWLPQMMWRLHDWSAPAASRRPGACSRTSPAAPRRACSGSRRPARAACSPVLPAPCTAGCALIRFGVSFGLAWSISATVPLTTGAAMLVPLRLRYGCEPSEQRARQQRTSASSCRRVLPGAGERNGAGARRHQIRLRQEVAARRAARAEARHLVVAARQRALRARRADRQHPGRVARSGDAAPLLLRRAAFLPRLPAAVTTAMPAVDDASWSPASADRSRYDSRTAAPTDRLTTRML